MLLKKKKVALLLYCLPFSPSRLLLLGLRAVTVFSSVPTRPTEECVRHAEGRDRRRPLYGLPAVRGLQPPHRRPAHHDHVPPRPEGNQAHPEALGDGTERPVGLHCH